VSGKGVGDLLGVIVGLVVGAWVGSGVDVLVGREVAVIVGDNVASGVAFDESHPTRQTRIRNNLVIDRATFLMLMSTSLNTYSTSTCCPWDGSPGECWPTRYHIHYRADSGELHMQPDYFTFLIALPHWS
jgi:hypothetical protein